MSFSLKASTIKERLSQSKKGNVIEINGSFIRSGEFVSYNSHGPTRRGADSEASDEDDNTKTESASCSLGQVIDVVDYRDISPMDRRVCRMARCSNGTKRHCLLRLMTPSGR